MKELASSTSTYYKAKAGTAYPLVDRLLKQGLLAHDGSVGGKGEKLISVTEMGITDLRGWLTNRLDLAEVAHTVDFVRLRVFYLGATSPDERRAFQSTMHLCELQTHLASCESAIGRYEAMGDDFSALATLGVVAETKARISWLAEIRRRAYDAPEGKPV